MTVTPQQFVATARQLGAGGNKYVLDTIGPNSYDCSGLVYRTLVNLGLYSGQRFSTRNFIALSSHIVFPVSSPAVGDIVLWASHHIGIVTGPNTFYSAYSPARGILDTSISQFPGYPQYYRLDAYAPTILVGSHGGVPVPVPAPVPAPVTVTWLTPAPPTSTTIAPTAPQGDFMIQLGGIGLTAYLAGSNGALAALPTQEYLAVGRKMQAGDTRNLTRREMDVALNLLQVLRQSANKV